jgi:hypothetical protein
MARQTKGDWDKAKALYEADKSLRQISDETRIDNSNIAKRAKKEEWQRGVLPKLIEDTARVREEFTALLPHQQRVVEDAVIERLKHVEFFKRSTMKNLSTMMRKVDETITIQEHTQAQNALQKGKETILGKDIDTAIQINNTQQTAGDFKGLSDDELDTMHALLQKASA